ncbi:VWA domain-containing protein [Oscillochloris sp. ZM17-4]|uniref:VWA domain-containing protein n=1 Tax=Oscillochloris sp. ZM17-4 TaxID=2866714 RepID=UPI001C729E12|nr:VWA domain-containing protein [Oscillochloris sp. ZM17-4]MBX0330803.1 VWA domain-containing protein [Oscillochloris sp. ZM17-4]
MRRLSLLLFSLLLVLLLGLAFLLPASRSAQAIPGGQVRVTQVDTSAYPQVSIFTSVGDPAGGPRANLARADFQIMEDGTPVDLIGFVGAGGSAISTALVVDRSGSMEDAGKIEGARAAAEAFVQLLRPGDRAALISFNDEVQTVEPFTDDQGELQRSIERLRPDNGTALYDAIVAGVDLLRDQPGRRALLVLTDGQDCRESNACPVEAGSAHSLREAIDYATAAGQAVYVVGLGERSGGSDTGVDEGVLRQIATGTDGAYSYSPDAAALADLYTALAGDLQGEYQLTYLSPRPFYDGTRRDIQVTVAGFSAGAGYTERHLINVTSSPLVGAALLAPLLGLLLLPGLLAARRRTQPSGGADHVSSPALADGPPAIAAAPEPAAQPAAAGRRCVSCDAPLRPGARFCGGCGATQPAEASATPGRRTFCDMCGRPLLPGATFCSACGEGTRRTRSGAEDANAKSK